MLLRLYNLTDEIIYLKYAEKILSAFYDVAKKTIDKNKISNSLFTYVTSLLKLYSHPFKIYVPNKNKQIDKIRKFASKIFYNYFIIKRFNSSENLKINNNENVFKLKSRELLICVNTHCEIIKTRKKYEKYFKKFLKKNYYKTIRIINF